MTSTLYPTAISGDDSALPDDERALLERARRLIPRVAERAAAADKARILAAETIAEYKAAGILRILPLNDESLKALPPPGIHPLVRVHPENKRKALFLNPVRIEGIVGMPDDEALDLVVELMAHATQPKYEYRHQWRYGDMVLWDNRSVMHKANPDYDMNERRYLYRLMLKGEAPIPVAQAAAVR